MIGYDIDGTLIEMFEGDAKSRRAYFVEAKAYYVPNEPFILITARGNSNIMRQITHQWAQFNLGSHYQGAFLLNGFKNRDAIKKHKAQVIETQAITSYYDDDVELLLYLKKMSPKTKFYHMELGKTLKEIS